MFGICEILDENEREEREEVREEMESAIVISVCGFG